MAILACAGAALAAGLCGCAVIHERHVAARAFTEEQALAIRNGETTRKEILDRFGPPAMLAREGTAAPFPQGGPGKGQIVYRYDDVEISRALFCAYGQGGGGCIPFAPLRTTRTLWILIDERTGRVGEHRLDVSEPQEVDAELSLSLPRTF